MQKRSSLNLFWLCSFFLVLVMVELASTRSLPESKHQCSITDGVSIPFESQADWEKILNQRNERTNATIFLGLSQTQPEIPSSLENQPDSCPNATNNWLPGQKANLMAKCPWSRTKVDLGQEFYPRYVDNATCLCRTCIHANSTRCHELLGTVTVFKTIGCRNGLALLEKREIQVVLGCYCRVAGYQDKDADRTPPTPSHKGFTRSP